VRVILKVWSSNPDNNGGCDFAVVEITAELAKLALRRIAALCEQKALDPAVYETYYWDSAAEFFSPWTDLANQTEEIKAACLKLEEELDSLQVYRHEMVTAAHGSSVPQSQIARVECAQMVVREEGIAFTAIPKYNEFYVTTAEIPKGVLEQAAMAV
jgi:hypothetical protein